MNVQEMHIAVQQGVDKINSLQADLLLPEEIDLELTKAQSKFINLKYGINNKYQLGFEGNQKRIDDLRILVSEYEDVTTYKENLFKNIHIDSFTLPDDYMYLVNALARVYTDNCDPMSWSIIYPQDFYYFRISMNGFLANEKTQIIEQLSIMEDPAAVAPVTIPLWTNGSTFTYPTGMTGAQAAVLGSGVSGITMHWESIAQLNYPDEIIVVIDPLAHPTLISNFSTAAIIGLDLAGLHISNSPLIKTNLAFSEKRTPTASASLTLESYPLKYGQQDDIFSMLSDPFNTTKYTNPLYTVRQNTLDVHTSDIFIINSVKLTYLRNPREISLSLIFSCELPDHTHRAIVDMTVSSILESIADTRYATHESEANKNE